MAFISAVVKLSEYFDRFWYFVRESIHCLAFQALYHYVPYVLYVMFGGDEGEGRFHGMPVTWCAVAIIATTIFGNHLCFYDKL